MGQNAGHSALLGRRHDFVDHGFKPNERRVRVRRASQEIAELLDEQDRETDSVKFVRAPKRIAVPVGEFEFVSNDVLLGIDLNRFYADSLEAERGRQ